MERELVVGLLKDLVSIDSVNPSLSPDHRGEIELSEYLESWFNERGIPLTRQRVIGDRENIIARWGRGKRKLLIVSHMDTVGVDTMTIPPFRPDVKGDLLYGRGSADTKGGMAAALLALDSIVESGEEPGEIIFAATVDEEFEALGIERVVEEVTADSALVMEPVDMRAMIAHKGFAWMEYVVKGRAAHGSDAGFGIDAIINSRSVLNRLFERVRELERREHDLLGSASLHASQIEGGEGWSTYPSICRTRVERRTLPHETETDVSNEMEAVLAQLRGEGVDVNGRLIFFRRGTEISPEEKVVRSLISAGRTERVEIPVSGMTGWPEAGFLNLAGIPSLVFGPKGCMGHESEEFVSIDSVVSCSRIIRRTISNFLS